MRNTYIAFKKLALGGTFSARNSVWVKVPTFMGENVTYNAYDHQAVLCISSETDLVPVDFFHKETLVLYDRNEKLAVWAWTM